MHNILIANTVIVWASKGSDTMTDLYASQNRNESQASFGFSIVHRQWSAPPVSKTPYINDFNHPPQWRAYLSYHRHQRLKSFTLSLAWTEICI